MKRFLPAFCAGSVLVLVGFAVFRVLTTKGPASYQRQVAQAGQVVDSFSELTTRPLDLEHIDEVVAQRAAANVTDLSADEQRKLLACISRFYSCYSSGDFEEFKRFRMHPPFKVGERLADAARTSASQNGVDLRSDEDVLRFAWNQWSGTNRIAGVSEESITVSAIQRSDLGLSLRRPSVGAIPGAGASCWEGALTYQPSPDELLKSEGRLRFLLWK